MQHSLAYVGVVYDGPVTNVQGLCPNGWVLPTYYSTGDFTTLDIAFGGTGSNHTDSSHYIDPNQFAGLYVGACYSSNGIGISLDQGATQELRNKLWTSNGYGSEYGATLLFNSTVVYPQNSGSHRGSGNSVRCLLKL